MKDRVVEIENPQLIREGYLMSYKLYRLKTKKRSSKGSWDTTVDRRFNDF